MGKRREELNQGRWSRSDTKSSCCKPAAAGNPDPAPASEKLPGFVWLLLCKISQLFLFKIRYCEGAGQGVPCCRGGARARVPAGGNRQVLLLECSGTQENVQQSYTNLQNKPENGVLLVSQSACGVRAALGHLAAASPGYRRHGGWYEL